MPATHQRNLEGTIFSGLARRTHHDESMSSFLRRPSTNSSEARRSAFALSNHDVTFVVENDWLLRQQRGPTHHGNSRPSIFHATVSFPHSVNSLDSAILKQATMDNDAIVIPVSAISECYPTCKTLAPRTLTDVLTQLAVLFQCDQTITAEFGAAVERLLDGESHDLATFFHLIRHMHCVSSAVFPTSSRVVDFLRATFSCLVALDATEVDQQTNKYPKFKCFAAGQMLDAVRHRASSHPQQATLICSVLQIAIKTCSYVPIPVDIALRHAVITALTEVASRRGGLLQCKPCTGNEHNSSPQHRVPSAAASPDSTTAVRVSLANMPFATPPTSTIDTHSNPTTAVARGLPPRTRTPVIRTGILASISANTQNELVTQLAQLGGLLMRDPVVHDLLCYLNDGDVSVLIENAITIDQSLTPSSPVVATPDGPPATPQQCAARCSGSLNGATTIALWMSLIRIGCVVSKSGAMPSRDYFTFSGRLTHDSVPAFEDYCRLVLATESWDVDKENVAPRVPLSSVQILSESILPPVDSRLQRILSKLLTRYFHFRPPKSSRRPSPSCLTDCSPSSRRRCCSEPTESVASGGTPTIFPSGLMMLAFPSPSGSFQSTQGSPMV